MNEARYLNTDLLIKSEEDLTPLINDLGEEVFVLHNEKIEDHFYAYLEISDNNSEPNEDIEKFCDLIESLKQKHREIWNNAIYRIFDIGYESGDSSENYSTDLRSETVSRIGNCEASIRVTIYPVPPEMHLTN